MSETPQPHTSHTRLGRWILGNVRVTLFLLLLAAIVIGPVVWFRLMPPKWHVIQSATMEFLKQEHLMFLVTDRMVTRVDVELKEGNILLGWRECVLIGTVDYLCGIDLKKMTPDSLRWEDGTVVITVPDPEVLQVSVDMDSLVMFSKRSGLIALKDQLERRDVRGELQKQLSERARAFAAEKKLLPDRGEMVVRLNEWAAPLLSSRTEVPVEFR